MRTTLDVDSDVLNMARALADARRTSIGKALSYLARRGANVPTPGLQRNGFCVFQSAVDSPKFGPEEVRSAVDAEDEAFSRYFVQRER